MSLTVSQLVTTMGTRNALLAVANGVYQDNYERAARQYAQAVPVPEWLLWGAARTAAQYAARQIAPPVVAAARDVAAKLSAVREHWEDWSALGQDPAHYGVSAAYVDATRNAYIESQKIVQKAETLINQFNHSRWHLVDPLTVTPAQAYIVGTPQPGPATTAPRGIVDSLFGGFMRFFVDPQYGREPVPEPGEGGDDNPLARYMPVIGIAAGLAVGLVAIKFLKGGDR
jgi:hypothetical protein